MKLYIDDIRNPPDESWTLARTVTEAIRLLSMFRFEEISLDHDISHPVKVGELQRPFPCDENFTAVAYFIAEYYSHDGPDRKRPKITVHSANPNGAKEIERILGDACIPSTYIPCPPANRLEQK